MKPKYVILIIVLSLINIVLLYNNIKCKISDKKVEIPRIDKKDTQEIIDTYIKNKYKDFKIIVVSFIQKKEVCRACIMLKLESYT